MIYVHQKILLRGKKTSQTVAEDIYNTKIQQRTYVQNMSLKII